MKLSLPIYIETIPQAEGGRHYQARPLFFKGPQRVHRDLERALTQLAVDLRKQLHQLGKALRHDELAACTYSPDLEHHTFDLVLDLRHQRPRCRFLFVMFEALGRKLAFTPALPELWFDLARGERLQDRATEVLTRHFRDKERQEEDTFRSPTTYSVTGKAWVTILDLEDIYPAQEIRPVTDTRWAALGGAEVLDGDTELTRVGRCLDRLYPDDLDRAVLRDDEVNELTRLLHAPDCRPVLLMGPRLVGKTALLHEYVFRTVSQRPTRHLLRNNVWLLAPQRLISGMSYVGQWENRLLAILAATRKHEHILYFDDLLGLYHAGLTSDANLSVAHVLKPYVERREFRLVAEITPEAYRVLREQDRGFAELFHLLPVKEPGFEQNVRILIDVLRHLEGKHRCRFSLDVLPAVLDLGRRHGRDAVMPGKAAGFLRRLAVKCPNLEATRQSVLEEFHAQSGLSLAFLDQRTRLERTEVLDALRSQVIGQEAALNAAADVVCIARARLNDPERPLASFLFLGPTGVGKTQCAKALAAYLFGDADKIIRFDMNEYVSSEAVPQLVGTFARPDGLLTSAVRRQPFAVVLLDEIEKAHPDVFDLLLQVLGEGRLTDALGRTVDFTSTIVVLTSNLGVRQAQARLGLLRGEGEDEAAFLQAAEKFFRPEFFNRLDRIVPFRRLARGDVRTIARQLIRDVFQREGLLRRKCILYVEDSALEAVVDEGYDPLLGARALKRAIERQLTRPVAARLSAGLPEALTIIGLYAGAGGLAVDVQALQEVAPRRTAPHNLDAGEPQALFVAVRLALRRIEEQFAPLRPAGAIGPADLRPEHFRYFAIQEQVERIRRLANDLADESSARGFRLSSAPSHGKLLRPRGPHKLDWRDGKMGAILQEIAASDNVQSFFRDLAGQVALPADQHSEQRTELLHQLALLQLMSEAQGQQDTDQVVLLVRPLHDAGQAWTVLLAELYQQVFAEGLGLEASPLSSPELANARMLLLKGGHALELARLEEGTHLVAPVHETLVPLQVCVLPVESGATPAAAVMAWQERRRDWLGRLCAGTAAVEDDPFRLLPVIRLYHERGSTFDLRSGLLAPTMPGAEVVRRFLLAALPLPPELLTALEPPNP